VVVGGGGVRASGAAALEGRVQGAVNQCFKFKKVSFLGSKFFKYSVKPKEIKKKKVAIS